MVMKQGPEARRGSKPGTVMAALEATWEDAAAGDAVGFPALDEALPGLDDGDDEAASGQRAAARASGPSEPGRDVPDVAGACGSEEEEEDKEELAMALQAENEKLKNTLRMYEDPPPPGEMDVRIQGFGKYFAQGTFVPDAINKLGGHWKFEVARSWKGKRLSVYRRYSDFWFLRERLVRDHPECVVSALPPKKHTPSQEDCKERMDWLQAFLLNIIQHPVLVHSKLLDQFLRLATEQWQSVMLDANENQNLRNGRSRNTSISISSDGSLSSSEDPTSSPSKTAAASVLKLLAPANVNVGMVDPNRWISSSWSKLIGTSVDSGASSSPLQSPRARTRTYASAAKVESRYVKLCWSERPLIANQVGLSQSFSQNVQRHLDQENGRLFAALQVARDTLRLLGLHEQVGVAHHQLSESLEGLADVDRGALSGLSAARQPESRLFEALADIANQSDGPSRQASVEAIMRSALMLQGARDAFELLQARQDEEEAVGAPVFTKLKARQLSLETLENTMADDLEHAYVQMQRRLQSGLLQLLENEIRRAQSNRAALEKLATELTNQDRDLVGRFNANQDRLGLRKTEFIYRWDVDTPM